VRIEVRRVIVFGSLNADLVQRVERLPVPGETIEGTELQVFAGGKGANQACAAGRLGGRVSMVGRVGDDAFGARLVAELKTSVQSWDPNFIVLSEAVVYRARNLGRVADGVGSLI